MDLTTLLRDAVAEESREDLQASWDRHLIMSWYNYSSFSMKSCIANFFIKARCAPEELYALKRVTKYGWQQNITVSRFVAGLLPVLSTRLFDHYDSDVNSHLAWLKTKKITTRDKYIDEHKFRREAYEKRRSRDTYTAATLSQAIGEARYQSQSGSEWNVCK